uniref:Leucine rich repeats and calponin homology domain containing 1 n=1 Tax=Cyprinus carpio carpio TaxID=630221 RepID=A0A9J8BSB0_CYPCA
MATLGPEPRPHSQLPSAALQANLSGLGSSTNLPLNRGLERALEDAASSGFLNLSTRKLKEFPRTASNYDLTDTVEADLSKNRLIDIPSEVCHLVSLETLNLYHNCIKSIPDTTISLQSLTYLNISRNQLSVLPACVCGLPLRVLNASNNKLNALPESIGQLTNLMELDVSCNEITALPRHIGQLKALRELNVHRNLLCVLPEDVADLPLVKFDFSCNKVSTIPVCYRKMTQLQSLQLENNPLQSPPAQICMKGKIHVFKYLAMEACRSDKMADALYLPDIDQHKKLDSDSGVGSDNGDKRLSATEPSDEDSFSLNVPMTNITEEEGLSKDDSSEHISALTGAAHTRKHALTCVDRILKACEEKHPLTGLTQHYSDTVDSVFETQVKPRGGALMLNVFVMYQSEDTTPVSSPTLSSPPFGLKPRSVFFRTHKTLESVDPQFTMRRKMEQLREELELIEQLRESIESRLKVVLPEDLGSSLMDGVVLCHLVNHIRPRSVASIHVPSPAVPKLSMAKCRRNVENFLDACREMGVPEDKLCLPHHVLEEKGLFKVGITVQALLDETSANETLVT